jgi:hypothetical protein
MNGSYTACSSFIDGYDHRASSTHHGYDYEFRPNLGSDSDPAESEVLELIPRYSYRLYITEGLEVPDQITGLITGSARSLADKKMVCAVTTAVAAPGADRLRQK